MKKRILVVDDEKDIVEVLQYNLRKEGYEVITAYTGKDALKKIDKKTDLVILDVMMPEIDGIEVCRRIKADPVLERIPVIFLTAKNTEVDEILGLEIGADDYLIKPVSIRKILAKIKSILRRDSKKELIVKDEILHLDNIELHTNNYIVKIEDDEIYFPKKEFETFVFLVRNRGSIVTREMLLSAVWGDDVYVGARTIDVHIRKIREKLGEYADIIETIKGVGYRIKK